LAVAPVRRAECGGRWAGGRSAGRLGFQFHRFVGLGFEFSLQISLISEIRISSDFDF
jgi:hypothetical protein